MAIKSIFKDNEYIQSNNPDLFYQIEEKPRSVKDAIVYSFQTVVTMLGPMSITPLALAAACGMTPLQTAQVLGLCMIGSGLGTLCQTTWGVRLPVV